MIGSKGVVSSSSFVRAARTFPPTATRPSTSRLPRPSHADRYLTIHNFFTRQAILGSPYQVRYKSTKPNNDPSTTPEQSQNCTTPPSSGPVQTPPGHAQDYTPFIRRLIGRSSSLTTTSPTRPTKEQLLAAAGGWWERLRVRLKWFTIRGWRRFNADDYGAFASVFVLGNTIWILIGTTTFVSAIFATLNSLSLQEYVARWISDYLTSETGFNVVFESAIVPKWGSSTISFRNVYISRRPQVSATPDQSLSNHKGKHPESESIPSAPIPHRTRSSTAKPPSPIPFLSSSLSPETYLAPPAAEGDNYTMFDVNLDQVEVSLSFMKWLDGKGLVKEAKVKGVRGVVDRRSVWWDHTQPLSPSSFRHATRPGDFELESLEIEDALVTIYQPAGQRPYNVSIFNATIGPFRKRWLFYDLMSAEAITGQFDNCLFSLHMPQKLGRVAGEDGDGIKRMARFRIDGLPIEHAQYATGHTGPMSWITSGKLDAVLDIKFPHHPDDQVDIKALIEEISRNVANITNSDPEPVVTTSSMSDTLASANNTSRVIPGQHRLHRPPLRAPPEGEVQERVEKEDGPDGKEKRILTMDIDLRFRDLKAAVPIWSGDLSVANNALIRPIVAFINANRTLVPIHCQVGADLVSHLRYTVGLSLMPEKNDFDGSWTLFETGLMTSVSRQIYAALAYHVSSETANSRRIRAVGFWGIQRGAEVLLETLKQVVEPAHM